MRRRVLTLAIVLASSLVLPAAAYAAPSINPVDVLPLANLFSDIGKAIVGGVEFTAEFFSDLFLAIFGGLADMLIPDSWARKGLEILKWLTAVPNLTAPAFKDLKAISQISLWIGLLMLATTLPVSLSLPSLGLTSSNDTPGAVLGRTAGAAVVLVLWPHLWSQGAAIANSIGAAFLSTPIAERGMNAYMELIAGGALAGAATGANFLGIMLVLFAACVFLGGLVLKVFLLLIGGMIYAGGPVLLGLVPTTRGWQLARTAFTAVLTTWALPAVWGLAFVVSGSFIANARPIGQTIGGGALGDIGGMLIAGGVAIAGPLACVALSRAALGPLGSQFASAASSLSPGRLTQKLSGGAQSLASKAGTIGGGVGSAAASSTAAGGPLAAMQRLMAARTGAGQAARSGASSVLQGGPNPITSRGTAAQVAMGSGLVGLAGHQAGRLSQRGRVAVAGAGGKRKAVGQVAQAVANAPQAPQRAAQRAQAVDAMAVSRMRPTPARETEAPRVPAPTSRRAGAPGVPSPEPQPSPAPSTAGPQPRTVVTSTAGPAHGPARPADAPRASGDARRPASQSPAAQKRPTTRPAPRANKAKPANPQTPRRPRKEQ